MDEKRTDLKAALRELAAEGSGDVGPHVGVKRLIAYRQGTMPAAESEAVQEHLSLCTRCTGLLREMRNFEEASAGGGASGPEALRQEAWASLVRRLPQKPPAIRPIAGSLAPPRRRVPRLAYALAAALLLAVVGLSIWATVMVRQERQRLALLGQQLEEREEALAATRRSLAEAERQLGAARGQIQSLEKGKTDIRAEDAARVKELEARVAELTSTLEELRRTPQPDQVAAATQSVELSAAPRFTLRGHDAPEFLLGGGAVNPVRPPLRSKRVTVALDLSGHPAYGEYRLELLDRDGKALWTGRRAGTSILGDAGTWVSLTGASPGLYRLRVEGLNPDRTDLLGEYLLEIGEQEAPK